MNILYTNRDHRLWHGGDSNKINHYRYHLDELGVETAYTYDINKDYSGFDIIHTFHLGHEFSYKFYLEAVRLEKPLIISPIYFKNMENPRQYRVEMLDYCSAIAFLSEGEKESVGELFTDSKGWDMLEEKGYVIPNGIDPLFEEEGPVFSHPNCPSEDYVLCVGRIDPRKNQARLALACKELDIPLLLIGAPANPNEVAQVQAIADEWEGLWWEPPAPPEKLAEAYRGAKVLACPSTLEMWPNVVAEGGLAGCNLVVSSESMSFTGIEEVDVCDPHDIESIKLAVENSYSNPRRNAPGEFASFTWERAAKSLENLYKEVLEQ